MPDDFLQAALSQIPANAEQAAQLSLRREKQPSRHPALWVEKICAAKTGAEASVFAALMFKGEERFRNYCETVAIVTKKIQFLKFFLPANVDELTSRGTGFPAGAY